MAAVDAALDEPRPATAQRDLHRAKLQLVSISPVAIGGRIGRSGAVKPPRVHDRSTPRPMVSRPAAGDQRGRVLWRDRIATPE